MRTFSEVILGILHQDLQNKHKTEIKQFAENSSDLETTGDDTHSYQINNLIEIVKGELTNDLYNEYVNKAIEICVQEIAIYIERELYINRKSLKEKGYVQIEVDRPTKLLEKTSEILKEKGILYNPESNIVRVWNPNL